MGLRMQCRDEEGRVSAGLEEGSEERNIPLHQNRMRQSLYPIMCSKSRPFMGRTSKRLVLINSRVKEPQKVKATLLQSHLTKA